METVDDVTCDKEGNPKAGLLDGDALELVYLDGVHLVKDGAYLAAAEGIGIICHVSACGNLVHLADFLLQSHLLQQFFHSVLYFGGSAHRSGPVLCARDHCGKY